MFDSVKDNFKAIERAHRKQREIERSYLRPSARPHHDANYHDSS